MYLSFFGLTERPFDLVPNRRFLFLTPRQREAFSNVHYGLTANRGLTVVLGEAGTGKTTLLQAVLGDLDGADIEWVLVSNPTLSRSEFYEHLTAGFKLTPAAANSKTQFLFEFRRHLEARHEAGGVSAILMDEAQSIPYELLEEIRLLSNVETETVKLLNVILAGQPELAVRLNEPSLRQLKQRIGLRCELALLEFPETAAYIAGRLRIAGGDPAAIFSREAILAIHEASRGVARTINVLCDNALMAGFAAQVRPVTRLMVEEVCRDFDLQNVGDSAEGSPTAALPTPRRPGTQASLGAPVVADVAPDPVSRLSPVPGVDRPLEPLSESQEVDHHEPPPIFGEIGRKRRLSFF